MAFDPGYLAVSPTLAADEAVKRLRAEGRPVLHMGFGQAPFPVAERLARALREHATENSYLPVAGLPDLREAVARHQQKHAGLQAEDYDVIIAPGSKLLLYALQMAIPGDLLLPVPSWVSYRPQAAMLGQSVIDVPTTTNDEGYQITPDDLDRVITEARAAGQNPTKLLINYPNNPTGLTIPESSLAGLAETCRKHDITIIADEIYGRLAYDGTYRSIAPSAPERTIVTTGLSKHLSLGGWRLGVCLVPKTISGLFPTLCSIASETWSCVAGPVQFAAIEAYAGHDDIEEFISRSTRIHALVGRTIAARLNEAGIDTPVPQGGFYLWPDFAGAAGGRIRDTFATSPDLAAHLLERHGIVALPGTAFGESPDVLKFRLSACDYDGAEALSVYERNGGLETLNDIGSFAPRVLAACDAFAEFVNEHA